MCQILEFILKKLEQSDVSRTQNMEEKYQEQANKEVSIAKPAELLDDKKDLKNDAVCSNRFMKNCSPQHLKKTPVPRAI
jgi:hypothetical protein